MNRQPSHKPTWVMHLVLALATCVWLYAARELRVSFILTVLVTAAITVCGGFITSIRANGLFRRGQAEALRLQGLLHLRHAEFDRLVLAIPALFATWCILFPERRTASGAKQLHEFALWVRWAFSSSHVNVLDWMMERIDERGRMVQLQGVYAHVPPHLRQDTATSVYIQGRRLLGEMLLMAGVEAPGATMTPQDQPPPQAAPSWAEAA